MLIEGQIGRGPIGIRPWVSLAASCLKRNRRSPLIVENSIEFSPNRVELGGWGCDDRIPVHDSIGRCILNGYGGEWRYLETKVGVRSPCFIDHARGNVDSEKVANLAVSQKTSNASRTTTGIDDESALGRRRNECSEHGLVSDGLELVTDRNAD